MALLELACANSNPLVELEGGEIVLPEQHEGSVVFRPGLRQAVDDFAIQRHEVTIGEYAECVEAGVCREPERGKGCDWDVPRRWRHPVNCVTYPMAQEYCAWRGLAMPTEAQWFWASQNRNRGTRYPWGEEPPTCAMTIMAPPARLDRPALRISRMKYRSGAGCGRQDTWSVESRRRDQTLDGVMDMEGNVSEFVLSTDLGPMPVGGSYLSAHFPRLESRYRIPFDDLYWIDADPHATWSVSIGFRCVRDSSSTGR